MEGVIDDSPATEKGAAEVSKLQSFWWEVRRQVWSLRLRRWLPRLVWIGDEIDIVITFSQDKLDPEMDPEGAFKRLFSGSLFECERALHNIGIGFDTGMGFGGRDWQWDWSLSGPVSVKFKRRAERPWRRKERSKPRLIFSR